MAIKDLLASENTDNRKAAHAAASGMSMTGYSGRHTEMPDAMFGAKIGGSEPVAGPRVEPLPMTRVGDDAAVPGASRIPGAVTAANRKPFGAREQVLAVEVRPGYRRYWVADIPGRVQRAMQAGYSHVLNENGAPVARITDKNEGRGRSSYLMEIPSEWYQDDMARQAGELERTLSDIRTGRSGPGAEDGRYIPEQGIRISGR